MKKFSRILSRRLARGTGDGTDSDSEGSSLGPATDLPSEVHQLPSGRGFSYGQGDFSSGPGTPTAGLQGGAWVDSRVQRQKPRLGSHRIVSNDEASVPCAVCARIDFPRWLDWRPGSSRPWIPLLHAWMSGQEGDREKKAESADADGSLCPFCVFFQTMMGGGSQSVDTGKSSPYMRIRLAFEKLGGGEKHELSREVLIEVTRGNRMLPWGYVVRAEEEEGDMRRYLGGVELEEEEEENKGGGEGTGRDGGGDEEREVGKESEARDGEENKMLEQPEEKGAETVKASNGTVTPMKNCTTAVNIASAKSKKKTQRDSNTKNGSAINTTSRPKADPATAHIRGRRVSPQLDPALPKMWLDFCRTQHVDSACSENSGPLVKGLRLVDCEERRVVSAGEIGAEALEYLTLSYVRGDVPRGQGGFADAGGFKGGEFGELPEVLPPLISDALEFTRLLGYRYIWVDRFCAVEEDDSTRLYQLQVMGRIYARSSLTLVVAAGAGVQDGIPGISVPREEQLSLKTPKGTFITSLLRPDLEVAASKWASRAWTYQEGLLSHRRLVFTPSQVYFQCRTLHCHETISLPLQLAPDLNLGRVFTEGGIVTRPSALKTHIEAYMPRALTVRDDRLDAFRGVLHEYASAKELPVHHFLGLPLFHPSDFRNAKVVSQTDRLAIGLGWMADRALPSREYVDPYYYAHDSKFPSWTWLAWHLRTGHSVMSHTFRFNLVGEDTPLVEGVSAAPDMEISVGFRDQMVLSWEIDGEAISRKAESILFLRVETYCFDLRVRREGDAFMILEDGLGDAVKGVIEAWVRSAVLGRALLRGNDTANDEGASGAGAEKESQDGGPEETDDPAAETLSLTGVLVSGRNWKADARGKATVLICARRNWDDEGALIRLGAVSVVYDRFVAAEGGSAVLEGVQHGEKRDLKLWVRELDLY